MFSTEAKARHAHLKAVPLILLTVKDLKVEIGPLDSEDVMLSLQANKIYESWVNLLRSEHIAKEVFLQNGCPRPCINKEYATSSSLALKALFNQRTFSITRTSS